MSYLEELLPEFRKGAKIRRKDWGKEEYIIKNDDDKHFYDEDKNDYRFFGDDFESSDWELYQEPIDWDYIIKSKCLCWFWDDDTEEPNFAGRLISVAENSSGVKYITKEKVSFAYCRPVRRDEVTFYEDRKDAE